jgi:hypothetical protein
MSESKTAWHRPGVFAAWLLGSWMLVLTAHAAGTGGMGGFGAARIGGAGGYSSYSGGFGGLRSGSSVIRHGTTGFSIYTQQGVTRVIGEPPVYRRILLPDGRSARVVGDGQGGASLYGAPGNHRIFGNRRLFGDDGQ